MSNEVGANTKITSPNTLKSPVKKNTKPKSPISSKEQKSPRHYLQSPNKNRKKRKSSTFKTKAARILKYLAFDDESSSPKVLSSHNDEEPVDNDEQLTFDPDLEPYFHIRYLRNASKNRILPAPALNFPPIADPDKYTLILDLDETLVHCETEEMANPDHVFTINFSYGYSCNVYGRLRPFLEEFLDTVSQWYEIVIFTASQQIYANKILNLFDTKKRISHRLFRDSCTVVEGNFVKDISRLGRDMSKTLIIDNSPQAFTFHLDNGVPITSWYEDKGDRELFKLMKILQKIRELPDVRQYVKQLNLEQIVNTLPNP